MEKKKIGIIGQFPPPIHGLSKALDTLCNSYLSDKYDLRKFNITNNKNFIKIFMQLFKSDLDAYYLTVSQSKFGNVRDLIIIKLLQMKKKKVIIHLHGADLRDLIEENFCQLQKKINYNILSKVDRTIVLGNNLKYVFEGIVEENRIEVVKNCVDDGFVIDEVMFNKKVECFKNKKIIKILYLSNFISNKGYKEVLQLVKHIKDQNDKKFKFVFAGKFFNEKDKNEFFKYIESNDINEFIEYKGAIYGEKKIKTISECDYFILLSKYRNEGQPISIIEAAVNGLRVISTSHLGIREILDNEEMIMIDKNNIEIKNIYEKINNEYLNRDKIAEILVKNRTKMLKEFSQKKYLENIDKVFSDI